MRSKLIIYALLVSAVLVTAVAQEGDVSVQIKRTNPGIAGEKSGELIFDLVNTDFTHKIQGFILCRSPDDAVVSSSLGAGSGSGAQYISPMFWMNKGPSQEAMSITLDADTAGDKRASCQVKYILYLEEEEEDEEGNVMTTKKFRTMQGTYIAEPTDNDYRVLRLDKTIPFSEPAPEFEIPGFTAVAALLAGLGAVTLWKKE